MFEQPSRILTTPGWGAQKKEVLLQQDRTPVVWPLQSRTKIHTLAAGEGGGLLACVPWKSCHKKSPPRSLEGRPHPDCPRTLEELAWKTRNAGMCWLLPLGSDGVSHRDGFEDAVLVEGKRLARPSHAPGVPGQGCCVLLQPVGQITARPLFLNPQEKDRPGTEAGGKDQLCTNKDPRPTRS